MARPPMRKQIAHEAARLLFQREEYDYPRAKRKAARSLGLRFKNSDLPSNREIRHHLDQISSQVVSDYEAFDLRSLRIEALRLMRYLAPFKPELVGSVYDGSAGPMDPNARIEIRVVCEHPELVSERLARHAIEHTLEPHRRTLVGRDAIEYALIDVHRLPPSRLAILSPANAERLPREGCDRFELEAMLHDENPEADIEAELAGLSEQEDRFEVYRCLLYALEEVHQDKRTHPEGDALYHSLQLFDLAVEERPYDEEFLTAALLHDVGKVVRGQDRVVATLELLGGTITYRTQWLIMHQREGRLYASKTLGRADKQSLEASEDFEDVLLLGELDMAARRRGIVTRSVDDALDYLRMLESEELW